MRENRFSSREDFENYGTKTLSARLFAGRWWLGGKSFLSSEKYKAGGSTTQILATSVCTQIVSKYVGWAQSEPTKLEAFISLVLSNPDFMQLCLLKSLSPNTCFWMYSKESLKSWLWGGQTLDYPRLRDQRACGGLLLSSLVYYGHTIHANLWFC